MRWFIHMSLISLLLPSGITASLAAQDRNESRRNESRRQESRRQESTQSEGQDRTNQDSPRRDGPPNRRGNDNAFAEASPAVGDPLPDITLYDEYGQPIELASLKGQYSVLVFGCLT